MISLYKLLYDDIAVNITCAITTQNNVTYGSISQIVINGY